MRSPSFAGDGDAVDRDDAISGQDPGRAAGESVETEATVLLGFPPTWVNRMAKATIVSATLAIGPATIATSRFHVGAFQYASLPSASRSSVKPFSALARAPADSEALRSAVAIVESDRRLGEVAGVERALDAVDRPRKRGSLRRCA